MFKVYLFVIMLTMLSCGCTVPGVNQIDPKSLEGRTILDIGRTNGHLLYLVPKDSVVRD